MGKSPVLESPSNKSFTASESNSVLFDYQNLISKLNELSVFPSKLKYQFDEFKDNITKEMREIKSMVNSKVKEIDSYISTFHVDLQSLQDAKRKDRAETHMEVASIAKRVDEVIVFKSDA